MFGICLASEIGRREPQLPEVNEAEDEVEKALITHEMIANAEALAPGADWPGMRSLPKWQTRLNTNGCFTMFYINCQMLSRIVVEIGGPKFRLVAH